MAASEITGPIPPYSSFTTVRNLIERMEREGVPSRIDNSYLVGMAGGTQNQVKHALRSMGLIDEDGRTSPQLAELAKNTESRKVLLGDLLRERYEPLVALDESATKGQLDEALRGYGLNGATARKAASFFVAAAMYAELPLSPHITPSRKPSAGPRKATSGGRRSRVTEQQPPTDTPTDPTRDMKRVYFELLVSKAKDSQELDTGILDRIERLVGLEPAPAGAPKTNSASGGEA